MVNNLLSIHAKSFSWAGFFLPSDVYKNGSDLYDFCRREVLNCYKNLTTKGIDDSIKIIDDILSAWIEIR